MGEGLWGGGGGVVWTLAHKELDVSESEGVLLGVCTDFAVLSWVKEEEEGEPYDIVDVLMPWCTWEEGGVQGVNDVHWEGLDPGRRGVCLLIGSKLPAHTKVELAHPVVPRVVAPHGGKDLA